MKSVKEIKCILFSDMYYRELILNGKPHWKGKFAQTSKEYEKEACGEKVPGKGKDESKGTEIRVWGLEYEEVARRSVLLADEELTVPVKSRLVHVSGLMGTSCSSCHYYMWAVKCGLQDMW